MPSYEPILDASSLPAIGEGYERATLDLKQTLTGATSFHLAKDVAAFANHLGGTILVGAGENAGLGTIAQYFDVNAAQASSFRDAISQAVKNKCSPRPLIDFGRPRAPSGEQLLAINVAASLFAPIGVRVTGDKAKEGWGGDEAWAFPQRVGNQAKFLLPEQIAMLMTADARRAFILLSAIPVGTQCQLRILDRGGTVHSVCGKTAYFKAVSPEQNRVSFNLERIDGAVFQTPLDQVRTTFLQESGIWFIGYHQYF